MSCHQFQVIQAGCDDSNPKKGQKRWFIFRHFNRPKRWIKGSSSKRQKWKLPLIVIGHLFFTFVLLFPQKIFTTIIVLCAKKRNMISHLLHEFIWKEILCQNGLLACSNGKTQFVLFGRMQFVLKVCSMHEVVVCSTWFSLFYQKTVGYPIPFF